MAIKTITFKKLTDSTALYLDGLGIKKDDPHYAAIVRFAGWVWLCKNKDLPTWVDYQAALDAYPDLEAELKKLSVAVG